MRIIILGIFLLLSNTAWSKDNFDIPITVTWNIKSGFETQTVNSRSVIQSAKALNSEGETVSFELTIYDVVIVSETPMKAIVSYFCSVLSVDGVELISTGESELEDVDAENGGLISCLHALHFNLQISESE